MEKYFLFVDAADDVAMYPVSKLAAVTCAGNVISVVAAGKTIKVFPESDSKQV